MDIPTIGDDQPEKPKPAPKAAPGGFKRKEKTNILDDDDSMDIPMIGDDQPEKPKPAPKAAPGGFKRKEKQNILDDDDDFLDIPTLGEEPKPAPAPKAAPGGFKRKEKSNIWTTMTSWRFRLWERSQSRRRRRP